MTETAAGGRRTEIDPDWPGAGPAVLELPGWTDCFYLCVGGRTCQRRSETKGNPVNSAESMDLRSHLDRFIRLCLRDSGRASGGGLETDAVN